MKCDDKEIQALAQIAKNVRKNTLKSISSAGAGHPGGALSAVEVLVCLYFKLMNIDPQNPTWDERDRFILSKGHASVALYSVLAEKGFFPIEELETFDHVNSRLQGHPDQTRTPGVDMSCGSLGQGLSAGIGMALANLLLKRKSHVFVLMGDGELQEGQVWEAIMAADHFHIDNLTAIVDVNNQQLLGRIETIFPTNGSIKARWESFGWNVMEMEGHNFAQILEVVDLARAHKGQPTVILSYTMKGKGVSFMHDNPAWHSRGVSAEELELALSEIEKG